MLTDASGITIRIQGFLKRMRQKLQDEIDNKRLSLILQQRHVGKCRTIKKGIQSSRVNQRKLKVVHHQSFSLLGCLLHVPFKDNLWITYLSRGEIWFFVFFFVGALTWVQPKKRILKFLFCQSLTESCFLRREYDHFKNHNLWRKRLSHFLKRD